VKQKFHIWIGNDQARLFSLLCLTLGSYAKIVPETIVTNKRTGSNELLLDNCKGVRVLLISVSSPEVSLGSSLIKEISGGDTLLYQQHNGSLSQYRPQCKLLFCANQIPKFQSDDAGIWARMTLVPFNTKSQSNMDALDQLRPAFMFLLLDNYRRYKQKGIEQPAEISEIIKKHRDGLNSVQNWIHSALTITHNENDTIMLKDLWKYYQSSDFYDRGMKMKDFKIGLMKYVAPHIKIHQSVVRGIVLNLPKGNLSDGLNKI
jgi:putative DNA primase/helicase